MIVSMIIVKNRLEKYRSRLKLLSDTGAEKEQLVKICIYECIRGIVVVYSVDAVRDSDMSGDCKKFVNRI